MPEDALREIQLGQSKMEEDFIKREPQFYQVPSIKLEPGLGLGKAMFLLNLLSSKLVNIESLCYFHAHMHLKGFSMKTVRKSH